MVEGVIKIGPLEFRYYNDGELYVSSNGQLDSGNQGLLDIMPETWEDFKAAAAKLCQCGGSCGCK